MTDQGHLTTGDSDSAYSRVVRKLTGQVDSATLMLLAATAVLTTILPFGLLVRALLLSNLDFTATAMLRPEVQLPDGLASLPAGVSAHYESVEVTLTDLSSGQQLLGALPTMLAALGAAVGLARLYYLMRAVRSGDTFTDRNAGRLATITLLVGVGWFFYLTLEDLVAKRLLEHSAVADLVSRYVTVHWMPLAIVAGMSVLSDVFKRGVSMRKELDEVV